MKKQKISTRVFAIIFICFALTISAAAADELIVLGRTTGIKLYAEGAIIIDLSDDLVNNPCRSAGMAKGDIIKSIDGERIYSNTDLKEKVEASNGKTLDIEYLRDGVSATAKVTPVKNSDGVYCLGVWIRDSIAGIGTLTFYDPETNTYGALGHGINDSDTNVLIPVDKGALMESTVVGVKRGEVGTPGELIGEYNLTEDWADIKKNSNSGIFGGVNDKSDLADMKKLPVAKRSEVKKGKATILTNLDGDKVEEFEVEIESIYNDGSDTKNMLLHVTDPKLIEKTGGIVRGMSGSPIIQNGKIVGAVTHVLINDPQKGYGIFIENMLDEAIDAK